MRSAVLVTGLLLLMAVEILRVYFIMPFPGSQQRDTLQIAYWIDRNIGWLRIVLLATVAVPLVAVYRGRKRAPKMLLGIGLIVYAAIFYFFNFRFLADKMFRQPVTKIFASQTDNKIKTDKLVIGVEINGEAKAYPVQLLGYHHQVRDSVGHLPVMITYCTVCRTGRAFSPLVNGKPETFRLVGMDHFNAMFEDATTKSWWQQATGVAVAGPLKGAVLKELPSQQTTLAAWLQAHPASTVLQADTLFKAQYDQLAGYDRGTLKSGLEKRDSLSWKRKSWVVGVDHQQRAMAYDWNRLLHEKMVEDSLPGLPLIIAVEKDSVNFHAWNRTVNGDVLHFKTAPGNQLLDVNTGSTWNADGLCVEGKLKGSRLQPLQAYQEFWHSWAYFHPGTGRY